MNKQEMLIERFKDLKAKRSENVSLWRDVSKYVGIQVDEKYMDSQTVDGQLKDTFVDDPTAAMSVIQSGDYIDGILWGNGEDIVTLEPSDWVASKIDKDLVKSYFDFRTKQLLKNMNHYNAGFGRARKAYLYDQMSFGTSGIGVFINEAYKENKDENPYVFRNYGVDNLAIDEGINGRIDTIFITYRWRVNRIVNEFKFIGDKLPQCIIEDYDAGHYNKTYNLVQGIYPREDYNPRKKGKVGAKYVGCWFLDDNKSDIFFEEDFREMPISVCRAIKVRGEVWGRGFGTMLISSIKLNNYMLQQATENIEKKNKPALGAFSNAVFGDSVVDMSSGELTMFNPEYANGQNPLWKLYDEGDPSALIQFLIPYFNEKITSGFKIDVLLDFNSQQGMTATESMHRYTIRAKSIMGIIGQQVDEMLMPTMVRCLQIEDDMGLIGINTKMNPDEVQQARDAGREDVIIPEAVLEAMQKGIKWYKIKFNGELDRMNRAQNVEKVMNFGNGVAMVAQLKPQVLEAVNEYDMITDLNSALGTNYIKGKRKYEEQLEARQQQAQLQAVMEQGEKVSQMVRNVKGANLEQMLEG